MDNSQRGIWSLTDKGEEISEADIATIPHQVRSGYDRAPPSGKKILAEIHEVPTEAENLGSWRDQLLQTLKEMSPSAFERLTQRLLREAGFVKVEVTGRTGDGGIDGVGVLRLNNLLSFATLFQCKRYAGTVGSGTVRDFRGAMVGRSDKGLIVTTGTFSTDARREATRDGAPAIDLIDGDQLCTLLKELKLGVDIRIVEDVVIDHAWYHQL